MKSNKFLLCASAALLAAPLFADRVDIGWINNVTSSWLDDANWSTGYAPGGENDPTPNASYAYLAGAHVDVILDGSEGSIQPISILGMYEQAKLTVKDTVLEISGDENITNVWRGSVLTLDNATLRTVNLVDLQDVEGMGTLLIAKNNSKLEIRGSSFDVNGATLHLQSASTLDAQKNGDFHFASTLAEGGKVIFEGEGSGITNWGEGTNRGVWVGGGAVEIVFKDTTFDGLVAAATTVKSGGFTFDNTQIDTKTTNGAFVYGDATINGDETFAVTLKNGSHLIGNGKGINAGLSGDGGTWQFNLSGGSSTENISVNIASAVLFKASNAKMQVNVSEASLLKGTSFNGGQGITGENSRFEVNLSGEGSRINFVDMKLANTHLNLRDVDNDAIHIDSAIYLESGTKVHVTLADRNADASAPIIFSWHVGAETNPEFIIDFSELTLSEGYYKFVIFGYQGDYHPGTKDFAFNYIYGENSGFSDAELQITDHEWVVWAYTTGYIPEPATWALIFGAGGLGLALLRRRRS